MSLTKELQTLHRLKLEAEDIGRSKKEADAVFKQHQARCLQLMEAEECESYRTAGTLFSAVTDRVKGQVDDRREFVKWALEEDSSIQEFLDNHPGVEDDLYEALTNTEILSLKENGTVVNQIARSHVDDGAPLPPGLTFRPDPYIAQRAS